MVALVGCVVPSIGLIVSLLSLSQDFLLLVLAIRSERISSIRPHLAGIQQAFSLIGRSLPRINTRLAIGSVRIGHDCIVTLRAIATFGHTGYFSREGWLRHPQYLRLTCKLHLTFDGVVV